MRAELVAGGAAVLWGVYVSQPLVGARVLKAPTLHRHTSGAEPRGCGSNLGV